jgi:hypothetical protein
MSLPRAFVEEKCSNRGKEKLSTFVVFLCITLASIYTIVVGLYKRTEYIYGSNFLRSEVTLRLTVS